MRKPLLVQPKALGNSEDDEVKLRVLLLVEEEAGNLGGGTWM